MNKIKKLVFEIIIIIVIIIIVHLVHWVLNWIWLNTTLEMTYILAILVYLIWEKMDENYN